MSLWNAFEAEELARKNVELNDGKPTAEAIALKVLAIGVPFDVEVPEGELKDGFISFTIAVKATLFADDEPQKIKVAEAIAKYGKEIAARLS